MRIPVARDDEIIADITVLSKKNTVSATMLKGITTSLELNFRMKPGSTARFISKMVSLSFVYRTKIVLSNGKTSISAHRNISFEILSTTSTECSHIL